MKDFIHKHRVKLLVGILALLIVLLIVGLTACRNDTKQENALQDTSSSLSSETSSAAATKEESKKSGTGSAFEASEKPEMSKPEASQKPKEETKTGTGSGFDDSKAKPSASAKPTSTPKPTAKPKATPTVKPVATTKPAATPTPKPTATPTAAPVDAPVEKAPTSEPTPVPTPAPTPKTEQVWVVDVPGHYETVTETKEVWVDEQGHYEQEKVGIMAPEYKCNQCGTTRNSVDAINTHLDESFDWDAMTGCASYTYMGDIAVDFYYEDVWIVDVPGHNETQTVETEVWVEEQGHYETVTVE